MKRLLLPAVAALCAVAWLGADRPAAGQGPQPVGIPRSVLEALRGADGPERRFEDFNKLVQGAKTYEGLFKLHQKEDKLYAEIRPDQLGKMFLCPIAIARGMAMGGYTLNFDEQWVLYFKRVGDKVHLIRRNVHFQAKRGSIAKAVETTYTDSVLMALRIQSINPMQQSVVINLNDIFMTDFAQLNIGSFDHDRSTWHKVKAFPKNIELEVAATYSGGWGRYRYFLGDDSVIDPRGITVVVHYGLCELPDSGYQPRLADDRVGHFLSVVKDFSNDDRDTDFVRYINRWRLEKADGPARGKDKLSAPKKKIVFWIEKSVPEEYRASVREGILEWNKAFEKIGFRDAIEVRQQEDDAVGDFDPEDIRYNTFRWITTGGGFAMGPSRANPLTGEIIDADIIFDADMVRWWKQEYRALSGTVSEPASLIQATRRGMGLLEARILPLPDLPTERPQGAPGGWDDRAGRGDPRNDPNFSDPRLHLRAVQQGLCQCAAHRRYELGLAAMALSARGSLKAGEKVPDELIQQAIKETVMHEVGHTLGLRHNFKASTMLKAEELNNTAITRVKGLSGSVMDYNPVNLAPKGVKQGDYFSTTIGPYDYWAIEYAYKPLSGGTEGETEELRKIASKGAQPGHDYATDEDMFGTADPLVNVWDLGSDPMKFAQDRMVLAEELMKDLIERIVDKGEGYQRARQAFSLLLGQYGNGAYLVVSHVGGEHMNRDHRGDPNGRDPLVPVKAGRQREALRFLQDHILTDKPFKFPPELLRRLAADRWMHWGNEFSLFSGVEYPLYERILRIQRIVLSELLDPSVLSRIQNNALKADKDEQALLVAEVFRSLTDGIWNEVPNGAANGDGRRSTSIIRRNLQRQHVQDLSRLVLGPRSRYGFEEGYYYFGMRSRAVPPDARSLARMHLREIGQRIDQVLAAGGPAAMDDTTRAHLEECKERINKVLTASMQVTE
jgi:Met-zincin/Domain of unknown function (DUF5117)/Domain of unknown function (DUF5118)